MIDTGLRVPDDTLLVGIVEGEPVSLTAGEIRAEKQLPRDPEAATIAVWVDICTRNLTSPRRGTGR